MGKSLPEVMAITEALVHMKVYPNRPDCLGLIGIARELAALLDLKLVLPERHNRVRSAMQPMPVKILDRSLCTRYTCQVISGVRVGKSSAWLASRLLATGSRPINNVVDITNFVMKEWGQPLHAFDLQNVRAENCCAQVQEGRESAIVRRPHDLRCCRRGSCPWLSPTPNRRWLSPASWAALILGIGEQPRMCCSRPRTSNLRIYA